MFPTWLPDAKRYSSAYAELGKAFEITYTWDPAIGASAETTASASDLFGTTLAVDAEKTVKCTAQLKFNGSSSAAVTSADHTITVVADGVTVSGGSGSHGDSDHTPGVQAHSGNEAWLNGTTTVTLIDAGGTEKGSTTTDIKSTSGGVSHEDYELDTIADGTYTVKVEKDHFAPVETEVNVSGGGVEVPTVDLWMYGDVNKDGDINGQDLQRL